MSLPVLTPEQRARALRKAREAVSARSAALAAVRRGDVSFADVLADPDSPLQGAKVRQVLLALPGVGPVRADRLMAEYGIASTRRLRGIGSRQRDALAGHLAG